MQHLLQQHDNEQHGGHAAEAHCASVQLCGGALRAQPVHQPTQIKVLLAQKGIALVCSLC
jgi:hypothetical protein